MGKSLEMLLSGSPWALVALFGMAMVVMWRQNNKLQKETKDDLKESAKQTLEDARKDRKEMTELIITTRNTMESLKAAIETLTRR